MNNYNAQEETLATRSFIINVDCCTSYNINGRQHRRPMSDHECMLADIWLTFGKNHRCEPYQTMLGRNVQKYTIGKCSVTYW